VYARYYSLWLQSHVIMINDIDTLPAKESLITVTRVQLLLSTSRQSLNIGSPLLFHLPYLTHPHPQTRSQAAPSSPSPDLLHRCQRQHRQLLGPILAVRIAKVKATRTELVCVRIGPRRRRGLCRTTEKPNAYAHNSSVIVNS
jgi:hypothetical protein